MDSRPYYEAYDDRYKQVHGVQLQWFSEKPSPIVDEIISEFNLTPEDKMLEIGCGEGRDAGYLLQKGYDVFAVDISGEAVAFCQKKYPDYKEKFTVVNCITDRLEQKFEFIYAVAVLHMLVLDEDRNGFYRFIADHLKPDGIALIGTMGDGNFERQSDISTAFELQSRRHEQTGKVLEIAGTSCRIVNFDSFAGEINRNGLSLVRQGITAVEPDFPCMMYAVVKRQDG